MKLESQVCSLDLSKRLKELGVAARGYFKWHFDPHHTWELCRSIEGWGGPEFAAFTVAELGVMLPANAWSNKDNVKGWKATEAFYDDRRIHDERAETEADARAKMLIHLIEQKLVTVEEVNARLEAA